MKMSNWFISRKKAELERERLKSSIKNYKQIIEMIKEECDRLHGIGISAEYTIDSIRAIIEAYDTAYGNEDLPE